MNINWTRVAGVSILLFGAISLLVGGAYLIASDQLPNTAEIQIAASIILGVGLLLVLLLIMSSGFAMLNLSDPKEALGLPEGSIRALIALILILIFIMMGLFLYRTVADGKIVSLPPMSLSQVSKLPKDNIVGYKELEEITIPTYRVTYRVSENGSTDTVTITLAGVTLDQIADLPAGATILSQDIDGTAPTYGVTSRSQVTDKGIDLAQQLLTTVGTLVVAVAGFYFGTRAVAASRAAVELSPPLIRSIDPPAGNQGDQNILIDIRGKNLQTAKTAKLVKGKDEMSLESIMSSPTKITGKLNINKNTPKGKWNLVVNTDGGEDTLPEAFTVNDNLLASAVPTEVTPPPAVSAEATPPPAVSAEATPPPAVSAEATPPPAVSAEAALPPAISAEAAPPPAVSAEATPPPSHDKPTPT